MLPFRNTDKFKDLNKKKPAAPGPHAPATVQFPGFAVPAKAVWLSFRNTDKFNVLNKKKPAATYFPALAVSSAQRCLTSVFGMGTGIATSPWPPAFITMPLLQGSGLPAGLLQALCTVFLWNTSLFPQGEAVIWPSLSDY